MEQYRRLELELEIALLDLYVALSKAGYEKEAQAVDEARLFKYRPEQLRHPSGMPDGGRWMSEGGAAGFYRGPVHSEGHVDRPGGGGTRPMSQESFRAGVQSGTINTTLRRNHGINKHDRSNNEYQRHSRQRQKDGKPPVSYFTVKDIAGLRDTILSDAVQSRARTFIAGNGVIKQDVKLDATIGITYNKKRQKLETSWIIAEYSSEGMHYYPIVPPQGEE